MAKRLQDNATAGLSAVPLKIDFVVSMGKFRRGIVRKQHRNLFVWVGVVALLAVLALGVQVSAQIISGDITGIVYDKTGAVVPHASVEAVSVETGIKYTAQTNETGE